MTEISQNTRYVGTAVYGIRMPIISKGADIDNIISDNLIKTTQFQYQPLKFNNRDIVAVSSQLQQLNFEHKSR